MTPSGEPDPAIGAETAAGDEGAGHQGRRYRLLLTATAADTVGEGMFMPLSFLYFLMTTHLVLWQTPYALPQHFLPATDRSPGPAPTA